MMIYLAIAFSVVCLVAWAIARRAAAFDKIFDVDFDSEYSAAHYEGEEE